MRTRPPSPVPIRLPALLTLLLVALAECGRHGADTRAPEIVVVPPAASAAEAEADLVSEGLSTLLELRLRAIERARVTVDPRGCAAPATPTHALRFGRTESAHSVLVALALEDCARGATAVENLVQSRAQQHDWSGEAAYWVARELDVPAPAPRRPASVDQPVMARFLSAEARLQRRTRADVEAARNDLRRVVADAPGFALASAELAAAELLGYEYGLSTRAAALETARVLTAAALAVDPELGQAYAARGLAAMIEAHYRAAVPLLARAAALNPGAASTRLWFGNALLYSGRPIEAIPMLEEAIALDPNLASAPISRGEAACYSGDEPRCARFLGDGDAAAMGGFVRVLIAAHRGAFGSVRADLEQRHAQINDAWVLELAADACAADGARECVRSSLAALAREHAGEPETLRTRVRHAAFLDGAVAPPAAADDDAVAAQRLLWDALNDPDPRLADAFAAFHARAPAQFEPDLWQIDLGLDLLMQWSARRADGRDALARELDRLRAGGVTLPVLTAARACMRAHAGDASAVAEAQAALAGAGYRRADLWERWRCTSSA